MNKKGNNLNKFLTIAIISLSIFILACTIYLINERREEMKILEKLQDKQKEVVTHEEGESVVYKKVTFGSDFDIEYLSDAEVLDQYKDVKLIKKNNVYYIHNNENVFGCEYEDDNYRYCSVKISDDLTLKIDFSKYKFVKNNE